VLKIPNVRQLAVFATTMAVLAVKPLLVGFLYFYNTPDALAALRRPPALLRHGSRKKRRRRVQFHTGPDLERTSSIGSAYFELGDVQMEPDDDTVLGAGQYEAEAGPTVMEADA